MLCCFLGCVQARCLRALWSLLDRPSQRRSSKLFPLRLRQAITGSRAIIAGRAIIGHGCMDTGRRLDDQIRRVVRVMDRAAREDAVAL